ncbi:MAG: protein adenylyltransferase SelO family protein, partial [Pseudomonadota bacterium]|nr:protein adenylyltransferase SelO family protein [Pseudomonadota bacterium]
AGHAACRPDDGAPSAIREWLTEWRTRLARDPQSAAARESLMQSANPARIPRNHRIEAVIAAALHDDFAPFEAMLAALADPYAEQPSSAAYAAAPLANERVLQTFCGT